MKQLVVFTLSIVSIGIALYAHAQQKGNNFELSNKSDQPIYFSLSDQAEIFKVVPQTDTKSTSSFITTTPATYRRAPRTYTEALSDISNYQGKLITLAPDQSLATFVDTGKQMQLLIARGKSTTQLNKLQLYRFRPNKTLYLKIDKQYKLVPQEGVLKPTLKGLKRFSRSGNSLEYNITPEEIKLVQEVTI